MPGAHANIFYFYLDVNLFGNEGVQSKGLNRIETECIFAMYFLVFTFYFTKDGLNCKHFDESYKKGRKCL